MPAAISPIRLARLFAGLAAFGLAGCASEPASQMLTPFFDDDFRLWNQPGPWNVTGQAFFRLPSGRVITCAGETVVLVPATAYNTELEQNLQNGKGYPANYDRRERKYERKAMCDGAGKFAFENVPQINWIVLTRVTWQEPSSIPYLGPYDKGGYLFQELRVDETHTKIVLSNPDFVADAE